ncbi:MAG: cell surface protein SprA [Flavobacteriales bacterium]|nr:cell surface protein SprA [Bacteroidales bacterium AH-315-I05]PCJ82870.1 MAG: cell surface protein SprA [Flavobacteriales bacterium]
MVLSCVLLCASGMLFSQSSPDSLSSDSPDVELPYNFPDNSFSPEVNTPSSGLYLNDPSNVQSNVVYDPETGEYQFNKTLGDSLSYRTPSQLTLEEYRDYEMKNSVRKYWDEKSSSEKFNQQEGFRPKLTVNNKLFEGIFGGNTIDIRPQGSAELKFGINVSKTENPAIPEKQRSITTFDFDESIQLSVVGSIGDKMKLNTSYNTEAMFDFENVMKLGYTGDEDEIIQEIDAGNVTFPLKNSLITGSHSLFGLKTKLKFGKLTATSVFSQQKGKKSEIDIQGGAQIREFEVKADRYEDNRHFFLSHFFRDNYEAWVGKPPLIASNIYITKIEVYRTNTGYSYEENRNIIAFQDLGEADAANFFNASYVIDNNPGSAVSDNNANNLYGKMKANAQVRAYVSSAAVLAGEGLADSRDYRRIDNAERLQEGQDYTMHPQLGYISLNGELQPSQSLAVTFQFTHQGQTYQVGEFSTDGIDGQDALYMKLLKSTVIDTKAPLWDLMMKNVYSLGAYGVEKEGFELHVWYLDASIGVEINYLPDGSVKDRSIIQLLNCDNLNMNNQAYADGVFDFLANPQMTIIPKNGKVFFPLLEPFGPGLRKAFEPGEGAIADKFAFDSLYTTTQANAQVKYPDKNRFTIRGKYQSSVSSDISLNALNIPDGSVTVTADGRILTENADYTVDYKLGRVKIINESLLQTGANIKISVESNALFNIQSKTMIASRFDYDVSKNFILGGTIMNLTERPLTQKINIGDEPISNTIWGLDGSYQTESQLLTNIIDKFPLLNTKEKSTINLSGEFAHLIPGHSRAIGKDGTAYIDDFEGSQSAIDIRSFTTWVLASTPQGQPDLFPEASLVNNRTYGFNRAKISWYVIDPTVFFRNNNITPKHIANNSDMQSNHFMREVLEQEVFPQKDINPSAGFGNIATFDLAYYPEDRGPYNYDAALSAYSKGINANGSLAAPETRWGGIMRRLDTYDFDAANIEFIQFWMMDPYAENPDDPEYGAGAQAGDYPDNSVSGDLYFNIGMISEDILSDGNKMFEHGLPTDEVETSDLSSGDFSEWGRIVNQALYTGVNAFDNDPEAREFQDVGFDGLRDKEELAYFDQGYLQKIDSMHGSSSQAYKNAQDDPSADNYHYFRGDDWDSDEQDILHRYKWYNGMDGNSPSAEQYSQINDDGYSTSASTLPNIEDINRDGTMDNVEQYFQYKVKISPKDIHPDNVGNNYITDVVYATPPTKSGDDRPVRWYQFKIPIRQPQKAVGGITDFRSIRFMRIFMKGFKKPVYMRFARMELIRGEWRKYTGLTEDPGEMPIENPDQFTTFNISAVNIEENGQRTPVNYILPPDIAREVNLATTTLQRLNEQALSLQVCDLQDGKFQAAYRNVDFDVRSYKRLKMFVHAEAGDPDEPLNDGDLTVFVRLGTDFENNYYEYEVPLKITPPGHYGPPENEDVRKQVWIPENNVDIEFLQLQAAKIARNSTDASLQIPYAYVDPNYPNNTIYVKGNPNLSTLKTVMIGIRNPFNDAVSKCAEIWVNELRLSDFDDKGGWAAIGRMVTKLADVGTLSLTGSITTPGFGSIDKKVSERERKTTQTIDASFSTDLSRFLPEKAGIKIPMYVGYSNETQKPQFNPLDPDIKMSALENLGNQEAIIHVKKVSKTVIERKTLNFTNVRKEKSAKSKKSHFYDLSNLSVTYAYSEISKRSIIDSLDVLRNYKGALSYNFALKPKNIKPFGKIKLLRSKWLRLIKDVNFYTMPKQVSFRTDVNRMYNQRVTRNNNPGIRADLPPFYNKTFTWTRAYDLKYDITKALKFDFQATNNSLIEEPPQDKTYDGRVDRKNHKEEFDTLWTPSVLNSMSQGGTNTNYRHQSNLSWNLPLNKFPLTNWINSTARYSATYNWQRAPFAADSLGHTIQNTNNINVNGTFNFLSLYNKVGYLKKVNQKFRKQARKKKKTGLEKKVQKIADQKSDTTKTKKKDKDRITPIDHFVHTLMGFKNVNITYRRTNGLLLPGYNNETRFVGMDGAFEGPGWPFIFGMQDWVGESAGEKFAPYAASKGWLVDTTKVGNAIYVNTQHTNTHSENINLRSSIEPIKNLRIDLTANRTTSSASTEFFTWSDSLGRHQSQSLIETGSYSSTYNMFKTTFVFDKRHTNKSGVFEQFLENRNEISQRLAGKRDNNVDAYGNGEHTSDEGYKEGYGSTSQEALIPSFLAAYAGESSNEVKLNPIKTLPKLNWRVTYSGLSKIEWFKQYFRSITINHAYTSKMNLSGYTSNVLFTQYADTAASGFEYVDSIDINNNYIPKYQFNTVTLLERFSPFLKIDMTWKNSLQTKIEYKRDRNVSLNISNTQVTEVKGNEIVLGLGYVIPQVELPIKVGQLRKKLNSDLKVRVDVSVRDNKTVIRKVIEGVNQITAGQRIISVKATADYVINERLNLQLYYDFIRNKPKISTSFPTSNTNAGIRIRFTLA